ncbi:MAG: putative toxin-antitoxin system toxin component, PIN family [Firmicutes bacterium]|nr:putative toxin-antitoxin system toxin component, PIN family [Bacillota bacterium]
MLDSNILISIAIFNSEQLKNLLEHICQNYQLVISSTIIDEIDDVIERKFPEKQEDMEKFLYKIPYEYEYVPDTVINEHLIEIRDPKDVPILYSAIVTDVDIFISGDKDFEKLEIERPEILRPSEFLAKY